MAGQTQIENLQFPQIWSVKDNVYF